MKDKLLRYSPYLILLVFVIIFMLTASLSPFSNEIPYTDSSGFIYMGRIIKEGLVPYIDAFDHKGLLVYFINFLGLLFNSTRGIWCIEILSLFVYSIFIYKTCLIFTKKYASTLITIMSILSLTLFFEGGNLVEEYALPFIAIAIYFFVNKTVNKEELTKKDSIIIGGSLAGVLWLRPNMIPLWIIICFYVLIDGIIRKKYQYILKTALYILFGIIIVSLPFLIYLLCTGSFSEMFKSYIIFNFKYANGIKEYGFRELIRYWINLNPYIIPSIIISMISIFIDKKKRSMMCVNTCFIVLTLILISISGFKYAHYGIILAPTIILPFAILFEGLDGEKINGKYLRIILYTIVFILFSYNNRFTLKNQIISNKENISYKSSFNSIVRVIQNNSSNDDRVLVLGNDVKIYNLSSRFAPNRYHYQTPVFSFDYRMSIEFFNKLNIDIPKLIVLTRENSYSNTVIKNMLEENYIKLELASNNYQIYKLK